MFGSLSAYSCQYALEGWLAVPVDVNWRTKEKLVSEDAPSDTVHWSRCRATMARCLDAALSVGGTGRKPHLLPEEIREASWLFDTFLLAYSHAASRFHGMGICVYKLRPKMHYTQHMVSELSFNKLNFYHAANFLDEDHMKFLKIVSAGCHVTSQPRTWARRCLTKQVFLWQQLQSNAGAKRKKKRRFAVKKKDAAVL